MSRRMSIAGKSRYRCRERAKWPEPCDSMSPHIASEKCVGGDSLEFNRLRQGRPVCVCASLNGNRDGMLLNIQRDLRRHWIDACSSASHGNRVGACCGRLHRAVAASAATPEKESHRQRHQEGSQDPSPQTGLPIRRRTHTRPTPLDPRRKFPRG